MPAPTADEYNSVLLQGRAPLSGASEMRGKTLVSLSLVLGLQVLQFYARL